MNKKMFLISAIAILLLTVIAACAQPTPVPAEEQDAVEALIIDKCSGCHSANKVFESTYTEEEWVEVFDDMIKKGADVNDEEKQTMIDWLLAQD